MSTRMPLQLGTLLREGINTWIVSAIHSRAGERYYMLTETRANEVAMLPASMVETMEVASLPTGSESK